MRRALQPQLIRPLAARRSRNLSVTRRRYRNEDESQTSKESQWVSVFAQNSENEQQDSTQEYSKHVRLTVPKQIKSTDSVGKRFLLRRTDLWYELKSKDEEISVSAKSHGSDTSKSQYSFGVTRNAQDTGIWSELLETVRARRRHSGNAGAWAVYVRMIQNKMDMPTEGEEAAELWEHFIQIGITHPDHLSIVINYATRLRQRTGRAIPGFYVVIVGYQLCRGPSDALALHRTLKAQFPPDRRDFEGLLRLSLHAGHEPFRVLKKIYKDHPVRDIYPTVVPELCKRNMRTEATDWHFLLVERNDLPKSFYDCKPLFEHYSHLKDDKRFEALARSLVQRHLWFEKDVYSIVRDDTVISREMMNRALGEAHYIAPKSLSDGFCARLFATKFFSVALVISGLQALGLESLGPLSLREIVFQDEYHCETVVRHIQTLQEGGIALEQCRYNIMIHKAALAGRTELLRSVTSADLHPDTYEDDDFQERLLAMYCEKQDHVQMERTLSIFQSTTPERFWKQYYANLILRCHISLRDRSKVISILEHMQRNRYPLAPRSSRHLRTAFLPTRNSGEQPSDSRQALKDIILMINVMRMTLQTGGSIPIDAWKEILKRLGMMGHLDQYQGLALWLVNWYSRPTDSGTLLGLGSNSMQAGRMVPLANWIPTKSLNAEDFFNERNPLAARGSAQIQNRDLLKLFGRVAQQSMIAWGFQAEVKRRPNLPCPSKLRYADPQNHWQWGLKLLKELQLRGVPVNKPAVARACGLRLAQLFNDTSVSKNIVNRRAKTLNDERSKFGANFRYGAYIKGIEEIWGRDLLNSLPDSSGPRISMATGAQRKRKRIIRYKKTRVRYAS